MNARLMAGGPMMELQAAIAYVSVVSSENACITLAITAMHDQEVKAAALLNAYTTTQVC